MCCVCVLCLRAGVLVMESRESGEEAREIPDVTSAIVEINKRTIVLAVACSFLSDERIVLFFFALFLFYFSYPLARSLFPSLLSLSSYSSSPSTGHIRHESDRKNVGPEPCAPIEMYWYEYRSRARSIRRYPSNLVPILQ